MVSRKCLFILSSLIVFTSCNKDLISPKGNLLKKEKLFYDYNSISVSNGFNLIISKNSSEKIEIEANENVHEYIEVNKNSNTLSFKTKVGISFTENTLVNIYVSIKNLKEIEASGGSIVSSTNKIDAETLNLDFSGGSTIDADLKCNSMKINSSGGSILKFIGETDLLDANLSGGSIINGFEMITKKFVGQLSGGSVVDVSVNNEIVINASGGSILNYKGNPTITSQNLSGGSQINKK